MIEGSLSKDLKSFLKKQIVKRELADELAVQDAKLGGLIKDKLDIPVRRAPPRRRAAAAAAPRRARTCPLPRRPWRPLASSATSLPPRTPPRVRSAWPTAACTSWCAASARR